MNGEIFCSLKKAQLVIENWPIRYNTRWRYSTLGYGRGGECLSLGNPITLDIIHTLEVNVNANGSYEASVGFETGPYAMWMQTSDAIRRRPLKDLAIPGSHDALTSLMSFPGIEAARAQGSGIYQQLTHGSRYLDLRASCARDGRFYGYHGVKWTNYSLDKAIAEIALFVERFPGEVVIITLLLDDNGTVGASKREKKAILSKLGASVLEPDYKSTKDANMSIEDLISAGHRIILADWGDNGFINRSGIYSENDHSPEAVESFFRRQNATMPKDRMWIWHPNPPYRFAGPSLETQAGDISRHFEKRLTTSVFDNCRFNIVNLDFVAEHKFAGEVIKLNQRPL